MKTRFIALGFLGFFGGCVTAPKPVQVPLPAPQAALSLVKLPPENIPLFEDDISTASLRTAATQSLTYYRSRNPRESYAMAGDTYTAAEFVDSLAAFIDWIDHAPTPEAWREGIRKNFQVYQSVGTDDKRTITFSSYYEPTIPARLKRTETYSYPMYGRPPDLVDVDLGQFDPVYQGARISGRREGRRLVPYHTRTDIDSRKLLGDTTPVIAWAKTPTDIFFMQIEGSGWLDLGEGQKMRIRYDGDNGRRYKSAGLHLLSTGKVGKTISHDEFETYLNSHPKERQAILNVNPRYVFFRLDTSADSPFAHGNIDVPLTPWRSVATDPKLFPKGMLAWIETDHPVLDAAGKAIGTAPVKRFVLNQDEGGAIQGPGRVDYFVGDGLEAHRFATHFWQKGTLYFLVKKRGS